MVTQSGYALQSALAIRHSTSSTFPKATNGLLNLIRSGGSTAGKWYCYWWEVQEDKLIVGRIVRVEEFIIFSAGLHLSVSRNTIKPRYLSTTHL